MKKFYSKILPAFIFYFCFLRAGAQYVTIPDTSFVNWLNANGYASCMSGNMMDTTCGAVVNATTVYCGSKNIFDLDGIQYFDNLSLLSCYDNNLTTLPLLPSTLQQLFCETNYISNLPQLPSTLTLLSCLNNNLASLPTLPSSLNWLNCNNNQLTSLQAISSSLTYLNCSNNQLSTLPALPSSLIFLSCDYNLLSNLPALPSSMQTITCRFNQLSSLPILPNSLTNLLCDNNQLSSLPTLPSSLTTIHCFYNQLVSLPPLPNSLTELRCYDNLLTSLPTLPNLLSYLDCSDNQLTSLPALSNSLTVLFCTDNQLTALPTLPNSLTDLYCFSNQLTYLPSLPNSLERLICSDNLLTSIASLPNSLEELTCYLNQLANLPVLPNSLVWLDCRYNQLTILPELSDSLYFLGISDNPNLFCLPELKRIISLEFANTSIQCIPNYGNVANSNPPLSSLPLCDLFNANNCDVYWNISGKVYNDSSNNCIAEPNELRLSNFKLMLDSAGTLIQQTYTGGEGLYSFDTDTGTYTYTVDTTGLPILVSCPVAGFQTSVLTALDSMDYGMDFGMQRKPGFDVGVKSVVRDSGLFRPANFARVKIAAGDISNLFGLHCATGTSGAVEIILSGPVAYVSAAAGSLTPVVSGDTLLYSIADFGTVNFNSDFKIIVQTDTSALAGQQICFSVNVTPVTGDLNATNNSLQHCFTVVNSFDPNNKEVFPDGNIDTSQHWLTYTINFQNTGTAPAQHIYILDTLDSDFDESTFALLSYSHNPLTQVVGNVVRFNFPNINLPDSVSDEPNSHGYVQYKVKLKNGLPFSTVIQNTANIIFDFNAPVVTNTTVNEIVNLTGLTLSPSPKERGVVLFPNPVTKNELTILFPSSLNTPVTFELYDITGRKVFSQLILSSATQQIIRLPEISTGCIIV